MKYIKPNYKNEAVETSDILSTSSTGVIDLGNGATLVETSEGNAQVGASVFDVLGLR